MVEEKNSSHFHLNRSNEKNFLIMSGKREVSNKGNRQQLTQNLTPNLKFVTRFYSISRRCYVRYLYISNFDCKMSKRRLAGSILPQRTVLQRFFSRKIGLGTMYSIWKPQQKIHARTLYYIPSNL